MLRVAVPAIYNQERGNVKDIFSSNRGGGEGGGVRRGCF